jgi:hypothetical protein
MGATLVHGPCFRQLCASKYFLRELSAQRLALLFRERQVDSCWNPGNLDFNQREHRKIAQRTAEVQIIYENFSLQNSHPCLWATLSEGLPRNAMERGSEEGISQ